jgi:hypothetical protein
LVSVLGLAQQVVLSAWEIGRASAARAPFDAFGLLAHVDLLDPTSENLHAPMAKQALLVGRVDRGQERVLADIDGPRCLILLLS